MHGRDGAATRWATVLLRLGGVRRIRILFHAIDLTEASRERGVSIPQKEPDRVSPFREHLAHVANPIGTWVVQQARNMSKVLAERAHPIRFLLRDRDAKFTASFDEVYRTEKDSDHPHADSGATVRCVCRALRRHNAS